MTVFDELVGPTLRIIPTTLTHAPGLRDAADPECFRYHLTWPVDSSLQAYEEWVGNMLQMPGRAAFTVIERASGRIVGTTSYLDIRPAHRAIEIGGTWISAAFRGTRVNPEQKLLLLTHAFESLACVRVQFKCDARNARSIAAILKLGAVREGKLRHHVILPDGFVRDTVFFSVIPDEWPRIRDGLMRRLSTLPP